MKTIFTYLLLASTAFAADPVVFLAHPRTTGRFQTQSVSETGGPYTFHEATDMIVLEPDGTERLLVKGNVLDLCPARDGKSVYYSQVGKDSGGTWADLFLIPAAGGTAVKLTDGKNDWAGPTGYYKAGTKRYVWNTSPCPTPDGDVFTSNRSGVMSPGEGYPAMQLFRLIDGQVEKIGHLNLGGAAHPTLSPNGKILWSSGEQQGLRGARGSAWGTWSSYPDVSNWGPEKSAIPMMASIANHFQTTTSDGGIVSELYYDTRIRGMFMYAPPYQPSPFDPPTMFGDPLRQNNPPIKAGYYPDTDRLRQGNFFRMSYQRRGMDNPLPFALFEDVENKGPDGTFYGMLAHPQAIPGNGILFDWSGDKGDNAMNLGVYSIPDIRKEYPSPKDMTLVVDRSDRHEWMAAPLVPWEAIYGSRPPKLERRIASELPDGSPYGVIGSSNVRKLEFTRPVASDTNTDEYVPVDVSKAKWIRLLAFNPTQDYDFADPLNNFPSYAAEHLRREGFSSSFNEKAGMYDQLIPIEEDGSIKAKIPGDQPWTVQMIDEKFQALVTAQTWHQVRPGEQRTDCAGCHAHNKPETRSFEDSIAGKPGYQFVTLDKIRYVEYERDIKSIDERLGLKLGSRPWFGTHADPGKQAYGSALGTWDDDPRLTPAEARLLREWQDTGFMAAGTIGGVRILPSHGTGPYADTVPPTLALKLYANHVLIGACDPQAGLKDGSLSVKSTEAMGGREANAELADLFKLDGDVWSLNAKPLGTMTVSIRDNQKVTFPGLESEDGNLTKIVRTAPDLLPDPPDEPDERDMEIAALKAKIVALQQQHVADIAARDAEIAAIKAAIAVVKEAVGKLP